MGTAMELPQRIEKLAAHKRAWLLFFLTAAITFSPFFLKGKVIVATTDSTFNHYPNILFGHRSLQNGDFGLWNPQIFCGIDFSTSFHHHMLHPRNWVLLLAPTKYVLHLLTLVMYLEISLIGCFAFAVFRRQMERQTSALFLAIVSQLCGFTWFTTTTMIGTHLLFAATASIYLLLTMSERRAVTNFVLLTLCFFDVIMIGHIGYIVAFALPVIAVFAWKYGYNLLRRPWRSPTPTVLAAFVFAALMGAVRIAPIMQGLLFEQSYVDMMGVFAEAQNTAYFTLTGFMPELMGMNLGDSHALTEPLTHVGWHIQFHNLLYFGLAPSLLLWMAMLRGLGRVSFTATLCCAAIATAPMLLVQYLSDLIQLGLHPFTHPIVYRVGGSFLFVVALATCLRWLETNQHALNDWKLSGAFLAGGLILAFGLTFWAKVTYAERGQLGADWSRIFWVLRILAISALGVGIWISARVRLTEQSVRRMTNGAAIGFVVLTAVLGGVAKYKGYFHVWATWQGFIYVVASAMWAVGVVLLLRAQCSEQEPRIPRWAWPTLLAASLLILVVPWSYEHGPRLPFAVFMISVMGMAKFALVALVAVEGVVRCESPLRRSLLIPMLCILTLGDLLAHTKIYGHAGAIPFEKATSIYPARSFASLASTTPTTGKRENLLLNDTFEGASAPEGWNLGGTRTSCDRDLEVGRMTLINQDTGATAFQDLPLPAGTEAISLGCWVRCDRPNGAELNLTCGHDGGLSVAHTGSGKWEWLSVTAILSGKVKSARPHLVCKEQGSAEFFAPALTTSFIATPQRDPTGPIEVTPSLTLARHGEPNLKWYRVSHPTSFVRFADNELMSSVAMVYGVSSYTGVDSDVKRSLTDLIGNFVPGNEWKPRGGIMGFISDPKALDLLGAGYDYDVKTRQVVVRPTALARLSLFESFEVLPGRPEVLARLKQDSFNHQTTLALEKQPGIEASATPATFRPVDFQSPSSGDVKVSLDLVKPAMLLFNDGYSRYWKCTCNGSELPIIPANGNFMAVALPAGHCEVEFHFQPLLVYRLAGLSAALAAIVAIAGFYAFVTRKRRAAVESSEPSQNSELRLAA
jgi:hypothetical protein